jgi:phospholipid/cholesterol/gamma-HCH transport system substrate-binding protein
MAATRSQKLRLGIFLIVSTAVIIITLIYLVGASLMEIRDPYYVMLQGSSGGLEAGSQVRFNDIVVGRVERVRLDPDDPSLVRLEISLDHDTPVTVDTVAVPEMANITGTKMLSMHGGTKESKRLKPGDEIRSAASDLSMITTKVVNIADRLQLLIDHLNVITNTENTEKLAHVITEVEGITKRVNEILESNQSNINDMVVDARTLIKRTDETMADVQNVVKTLNHSAQQIMSAKNMHRIDTLLDTTRSVMNNVENRTSKEELGATIESVNELAMATQVTIVRMRDDLRRIMNELETSVENINEFTQILVDDPSVLITGRNEKERQLP